MRWFPIAIGLVACGRVGFGPVAPGNGDGGAGGDGASVDARTVVTPPVPVTDPGAKVYLVDIENCYDVAWTGTEWGVAWEDQRDGSAGEIYFTRLAPDGTKLAPDVRVTNDPATTQCPSLVWNGSSYVTVFADNRPGNFDIYGQVIGANGALNSAVVRITSDNSDSTEPAIAWDGSGYDLVWRDQRGTNVTIHYLRLDATLAAVGAPLVMSGTGSNTGDPAVVETSAGAALAWHDDSSGTPELQLALVQNGATTFNVAAGPAVFQPGGLTPRAPPLAWTGAALATAYTPSTDLVFSWIDLASGAVTPGPSPNLGLGIHATLVPGGGGFALVVEYGVYEPLAADGSPADAISHLDGGSAVLEYDGAHFGCVSSTATALQFSVISP